MADYSKEQLKELYKDLPEDLQKAVFSEDIGEKVRGICYDNNVIDNEAFMDVLKSVGYVFLGLLPPEDFKKAVNKINDTGEVAARINNEVFSEMREGLETLYGVKIGFEKSKAPAPKKPAKEDRYLEPLE